MEINLSGICQGLCKYGNMVLVLDKESVIKVFNITGNYENRIYVKTNRIRSIWKMGEVVLLKDCVGNFIKVKVKREAYFIRDQRMDNYGTRGYRYVLLEVSI